MTVYASVTIVQGGVYLEKKRVTVSARVLVPRLPPKDLCWGVGLKGTHLFLKKVYMYSLRHDAQNLYT